jgi:transcriptional regulator
MPPRSDLPQGTLDLLILHVVAAGAIHGYAIAQRLQLISRDVVQVPQGSLYPALHRLEDRGLLTADWKMSDTGREAKFYRLTPKGRRQLKEEAASWLRLTEAIGLILKPAASSRYGARRDSSRPPHCESSRDRRRLSTAHIRRESEWVTVRGPCAKQPASEDRRFEHRPAARTDSGRVLIGGCRSL